MCGICGIFAYRGADADADTLHRMTDLITHRGPDDAGYHVQGPVALGMRRLSIIDLDTGRQPIANEDGSVVVVCNGEIYNFRDLRPGLEARNHRLITSGDLEP
ncbi:MAG TPA: asparagine synthetase B, partial [Candidatus Krumholzibacteria bacterium]|nr:asparagine synthetase B [Candidatus Krumholzibacteria bacterium]